MKELRVGMVAKSFNSSGNMILEYIYHVEQVTYRSYVSTKVRGISIGGRVRDQTHEIDRYINDMMPVDSDKDKKDYIRRCENELDIQLL